MKLTYTAEELAKAPRLVPDLTLYKVDAMTVVKTCDPGRLAEAETLRLVRKNTSIPVPEVYNAYIDKDLNRAHIVMEYIEGDVLRDVWDTFSEGQQEAVIVQLKAFMAELRTFKGDFIGSVDRTYCEDQFFTDDLGAYGPFVNEKEFHQKGLIRALESADGQICSAHTNMVAEMIRAMPTHDIVLTHGDFTPRNILVRGSTVVALLDWELAGYYLAYWEYVKALYRPDWQSGWVQSMAVEQILSP